MEAGDMEVRHEELTELPPTAICGNDITSSYLCVSTPAILAAGKYAAVSMLLVAVVLDLFRSLYAEVVGALLAAMMVLTIIGIGESSAAAS